MHVPGFFRFLPLLLPLSSLLACDPPPRPEAPPPSGCGPGMVELAPREGARFCLDTHVVTVAQYQDCVGRAQCSVSGQDKGCRRDDLLTQNEPINCVDFAQADAYCKSRQKRLPTIEELHSTPFFYDTQPITPIRLPEWSASPGGAKQRMVLHDQPMSRQPLMPFALPENSYRVDLGFRCAR